VAFAMDVIAGRLPKGNEQSRAQQIDEGTAHSVFILCVATKLRKRPPVRVDRTR
jgi:hypothetical protein